MRFKSDWIKKLILLALSIATLTFLIFKPLHAQNEGAPATAASQGVKGGNTGSTVEEYLYNIMQNTYGILLEVNNLPVYMKTLTDMANEWIMKDDSDSTADLQGSLSNIANTILTDNNERPNIQPKLLNDLFQKATPAILPNANDLSYQTMIGAPFFAKDPRNPPGAKPPPFDAAYNYVKNAAGMNITHVMPARSFTGADEDQIKYANFYNTMMAAESFGGYALSGLYVDFQNGGTFTSTQTQLIQQASGSDWFSQIAAEKIGTVLRQLLMYQSQSYILLTQLIQLQKQLLTAQVITNSLLILNATNSEQTLMQKASGIPIRP